MSTPSTQQAAPAPPKSRYSMGTMPNMLRSLLVVGFFVLVLVAIVPRKSEIERPAVDAGGKAAAVAAQTRWAVEMPTGLGNDWVPTTATYGIGTDKVPTFTTVWRTPSGGNLAFKQATKPTNTWVSTSVTDNPAAGAVTVGGRSLERYAGGRTSQVSYLVRPAATGGLTLVATTDGGEDELKAFVAALRPVTPSAS
ncbi:MAG: hypothetical protein JWP82_2371 [Humibacillus sp.]|nr:hypothetical protein [Humibacillus sp.]